MEISFYHLTLQPLNTALPKLLGKVIDAEMKAVIKVSTKEQMEEIDLALWEYDKESFLPHDTMHGKYKVDQPIFITMNDENPSGAEVLILTDNAEVKSIEGYSRVIEMFDGKNPTIVEQARTKWTHYKAADHELTYWQQTETGGWSKRG
jgi:DNA polymerase III subunit chi